MKRAIDQNVDLAQTGIDRGKGFFDRSAGGDVAAQGDAVSTCLVQLPSDLLSNLNVDVAEHDFGTLAGEAP